MIVHAIKVNKGFLFIINILFMCFILVSCAPSWHESYRIERAWFDTSDIYIHFKRSKSASLWVIFMAHDEITFSEKESYFLYRLPRAKLLPTKTTIDLDDAEPVDNELLYKDKDFSIVGNAHAWNYKLKVSTIKGKEKTTILSNCTDNWIPDPIRINDSLFYCGELFDPSGEIKLKIPDKIIEQFQQEVKARQLASGNRIDQINLPDYPKASANFKRRPGIGGVLTAT